MKKNLKYFIAESRKLERLYLLALKWADYYRSNRENADLVKCFTGNQIDVKSWLLLHSPQDLNEIYYQSTAVSGARMSDRIANEIKDSHPFKSCRSFLTSKINKIIESARSTGISIDVQPMMPNNFRAYKVIGWQKDATKISNLLGLTTNTGYYEKQSATFMKEVLEYGCVIYYAELEASGKMKSRSIPLHDAYFDFAATDQFKLDGSYSGFRRNMTYTQLELLFSQRNFDADHLLILKSLQEFYSRCINESLTQEKTAISQIPSEDELLFQVSFHYKKDGVAQRKNYSDLLNEAKDRASTLASGLEIDDETTGVVESLFEDLAIGGNIDSWALSRRMTQLESMIELRSKETRDKEARAKQAEVMLSQAGQTESQETNPDLERLKAQFALDSKELQIDQYVIDILEDLYVILSSYSVYDSSGDNGYKIHETIYVKNPFTFHTGDASTPNIDSIFIEQGTFLNAHGSMLSEDSPAYYLKARNDIHYISIQQDYMDIDFLPIVFSGDTQITYSPNRGLQKQEIILSPLSKAIPLITEYIKVNIDIALKQLEPKRTMFIRSTQALQGSGDPKISDQYVNGMATGDDIVMSGGVQIIKIAGSPIGMEGTPPVANDFAAIEHQNIIPELQLLEARRSQLLMEIEQVLPTRVADQGGAQQRADSNNVYNSDLMNAEENISSLRRLYVDGLQKILDLFLQYQIKKNNLIPNSVKIGINNGQAYMQAIKNQAINEAMQMISTGSPLGNICAIARLESIDDPEVQNLKRVFEYNTDPVQIAIYKNQITNKEAERQMAESNTEKQPSIDDMVKQQLAESTAMDAESRAKVADAKVMEIQAKLEITPLEQELQQEKIKSEQLKQQKELLQIKKENQELENDIKQEPTRAKHKEFQELAQAIGSRL